MIGDKRRMDAPEAERRRSLLVGTMIGVAVMAAVDEIVFHQLLGWHHFYDRSATDVALLSDGVLHAAEVVLLVAGFVLLNNLRGRRTLATSTAWAGVLLGSGAFQLWDGLIDHKVLQVHQIRYDVDLLPYDLAWNTIGVVLLVAGACLAWRHRRHRRRSDRGQERVGIG